MNDEGLLILVIIIVAVVIDLLILAVIAKRRRSDESRPEVRVLGRYSPLLTWVKYRRAPHIEQKPRPAKSGPQPAPRELLPAKQKRLFPVRLHVRLLRSLRSDHSAAASDQSRLTRRSLLIDLGLILALALIFGHALLDFNPDRVLTGSEWDVFATPDIVLRQSILKYGVFPLWNPYLAYGVPYLGDPFVHAFNPVIGLPVLAWGEVNGMKIALLLSFFIAGLGQYCLGYQLGLNRFARLWSAAIFTMNGQFAARFLQGHYNFLPTAAWLPWVLVAVLMCFKNRRKWPIILGACALAGMLLSGNPYYVLYTVSALLPIGLISLAQVDLEQLRVRLDRRGLARLISLMALGGLLAAVTLLPQLEMSPRLHKEIGAGLGGSQPPQYAIVNYWVDDVEFANSNALGKLPIDEEYYSYIGIAPFTLMLFLPLAFRPGRRRDLLALLGALGMMFLWADAQHSIIGNLYTVLPGLAGFRYPNRALILGTSLIPLLGAYGLDEILSRVRGPICVAWQVCRQSGPSQPPRQLIAGNLPITYLLTFAIALLALSGVWNIYHANELMVRTVPRYTAGDTPLSWLQQYDPSTYLLNAPLPSGWHQDIFTREFHWMNPWYGWSLYDTPPEAWDVAIPNLLVNGKYLIVWDTVTPTEQNAQLVKKFDGYNVYRLPDSPPYAYVYDNTPGDNDQPPLLVEAQAHWANPNELDIVATAGPNSYVGALVASYPGWSVTIDDVPARVLDMSATVGTAAQPGTHIYRFTFSSEAAMVGLIGSLLAVVILFGYGLRGTRHR